MCRPLSGWALKPGDDGISEIVWDPEHTDSHTVLQDAFGIVDDNRSAVPFEIYPENWSDAGDADRWIFHHDRDIWPEWWTPEIQDDVSRRLRSQIKAAIITEPRKCILGGWHILVDSEIQALHSCRVIVMIGTARVGEMWESSQVGEMRDSSKVGVMRESSKVGEMWESSKVLVDNRIKKAEVPHAN